MGVYTEDAKELARLIGGKENIAAVSHCMTRMRFVLQEPQKADVQAIGGNEGCQGMFYAVRAVPGDHREHGG